MYSRYLSIRIFVLSQSQDLDSFAGITHRIYISYGCGFIVIFFVLYSSPNNKWNVNDTMEDHIRWIQYVPERTQRALKGLM
jgi:hypothetical protein